MLITNGKIITWEKDNQILEGQALYIEGDRIEEIAPQDELVARYPDEEQLDAKGQYVMPGNICAHTHFYGAYARGMGIPGAPPKDFPQILAGPFGRADVLPQVRVLLLPDKTGNVGLSRILPGVGSSPGDGRQGDLQRFQLLEIALLRQAFQKGQFALRDNFFDETVRCTINADDQ